MIFRQLFDSETWTYSYLLADRLTGEALLIDSVFEKHLRDLALLRELGLKLRYTVDTHVHADHVTGAWLMRQATGSQIAVAKVSNADGADLYLEDGDVLAVGSVKLVARSTPGHTDGCMTYVLADQSMAFTGDALLIRGRAVQIFRWETHGGSSSLCENRYSVFLVNAHSIRATTTTVAPRQPLTKSVSTTRALAMVSAKKILPVIWRIWGCPTRKKWMTRFLPT